MVVLFSISSDVYLREKEKFVRWGGELAKLDQYFPKPSINKQTNIYFLLKVGFWNRQYYITSKQLYVRATCTNHPYSLLPYPSLLLKIEYKLLIDRDQGLYGKYQT